MIISNFTAVISKEGKISLINTINDSKTLDRAKEAITNSFKELDKLFKDGYEVVNGLYSIFINEPQDSYHLGTTTPVDNLEKLYEKDIRKDNRWVYSNIYDYNIETKEYTRFEVTCDGAMLRREPEDYDDTIITYHNGDIVEVLGEKYIITSTPSFNKYKWENSYLLNPIVTPRVLQDASKRYEKDPLLKKRVHASLLGYVESPDIKYTCNIYFVNKDDEETNLVLRTDDVSDIQDAIDDFAPYTHPNFLVRISINEDDNMIEISNYQNNDDSDVVSVDAYSNKDNIMRVINGRLAFKEEINVQEYIDWFNPIEEESEEEEDIVEATK